MKMVLTIVTVDASAGDKLILEELQEMAKEEPALQAISEERRKELIDELEEHRKLKKTGMRANNRAAAQDARLTLKRLHAEVRVMIILSLYQLTHHFQIDDLAERTGVYMLTFHTRGHIDDETSPGWYATADAAFFVREQLNREPWDIVRLFEQWACSRERSTYRS